MDVFLKITLYAENKHEMMKLLRRLMDRIGNEPDDGCGQWRYEWTNIPKEEDED